MKYAVAAQLEFEESLNTVKLPRLYNIKQAQRKEAWRLKISFNESFWKK